MNNLIQKLKNTINFIVKDTISDIITQKYIVKISTLLFLTVLTLTTGNFIYIFIPINIICIMFNIDKINVLINNCADKITSTSKMTILDKSMTAKSVIENNIALKNKINFNYKSKASLFVIKISIISFLAIQFLPFIENKNLCLFVCFLVSLNIVSQITKIIQLIINSNYLKDTEHNREIANNFTKSN